MLVSSYFDAEGNYFEDKLEYENKREEDVQIANGVLVVECRIVMLNCSKKRSRSQIIFVVVVGYNMHVQPLVNSYIPS